jgi:hypothetical protein
VAAFNVKLGLKEKHNGEMGRYLPLVSNIIGITNNHLHLLLWLPLMAAAIWRTLCLQQKNFHSKYARTQPLKSSLF